MSAVIFTKSFIEAAGTPATGPFHYRPLTISPFRLMGFFISLFLSHGLCYRLFPAIDPLLSAFLSHGLCYRSFPVIDPLLPALFVAWALLLAVPYYRPLTTSPFLRHRLSFRPFLLPAAYYLGLANIFFAT